MMKIVKWTAGIIIFFSHLDQVSSYNPQLLDSMADSFNERIYVKAPISIKQIQDNLSFLEDEDTVYITQYAEKNVFESYKSKIENRDNEFTTFYYNCKKIYDSNDIIDPVTQVAVQMMFERVFQKHEQHLNLLSSMSHLLLTKTPDDESHELDNGFVRDVCSPNESSSSHLLGSILSVVAPEERVATPSFELTHKLVTSH